MKVIKIGAVWCSGCLVMRPRWQEIERENPWLQTQYFDYDEQRSDVERYGLDANRLPTFVFIDKDGQEFLRLHGEIAKDELMRLIAAYRDR